MKWGYYHLVLEGENKELSKEDFTLSFSDMESFRDYFWLKKDSGNGDWNKELEVGL